MILLFPFVLLGLLIWGLTSWAASGFFWFIGLLAWFMVSFFVVYIGKLAGM